MLGNNWLRKSNLLFSWSAWTTVQVSQCPSFGIFLRFIGKMDYLAPRVEKRCSWAFEANQRQIHVFYGVIVSGLTPGSWDWATYLSAKWSAEDQDIIYLPYCIEDILMRNKCHSTTNRGWNLIFFTELSLLELRGILENSVTEYSFPEIKKSWKILSW